MDPSEDTNMPRNKMMNLKIQADLLIKKLDSQLNKQRHELEETMRKFKINCFKNKNLDAASGYDRLIALAIKPRALINALIAKATPQQDQMQNAALSLSYPEA